MSESLPTYSRQAIADVIARAQTRGERLVSLARLLLVSGSLARTVSMWGGEGHAPTPTRFWLTLLLGATTLGFSAWILLAFRTRAARAPLFTVSVALDAVLCFLALGTNSIWAGPGYPGILNMPDIGSLLVITAISGLRLSIPAALVSGALNGASFIALVLLDRQLHGFGIHPATDPLGMFALLLASATGLALLVARAARSLVEEGALRALEAERAERGLGVLMQEHHDLRSMLSAAALDADHLLRELGGARAADVASLADVARELREGLVRVNEHVASIREHAYGELEVLRGVLPVSLAKVATSVAQELGPLFPQTSIAVGEELERVSVWAAGGELALRRVLFNLASNACEGDGQRKASRVALRAELRDGGQLVELRVEDDGPGFPEAILSTPLERRRTSKPDGSGLGLLIVSGLLGPQAHTLRRGNGPAGGARVSFELPVAAAS